MPYDQAVKKVRHDLMDSTIVERLRYDAIVVDVFFSSALPPPMPSLADMPLSGDARDTNS